MRKAEEEAIRRARREIVRLREAEEVGVLGDLVGELGEDPGSGAVVVDDEEGNGEDEDVDMESDDD